MSYHRLNISQRIEIERQLQASASQSAIARRIGVHRSTVSNEIRRNSWKGKYLAHVAHLLMKTRESRTYHCSRKRIPSLRRKKDSFDFLALLKSKHQHTDRRKDRIRRRREIKQQRKPYRIYNWSFSESAITRRWINLKRRKRNHWLENQLRHRRTIEDWQSYRHFPYHFHKLGLIGFYRKSSVNRPEGLFRGVYRPRDKWSDAWIERHLHQRVRTFEPFELKTPQSKSLQSKARGFILRPKRRFLLPSVSDKLTTPSSSNHQKALLCPLWSDYLPHDSLNTALELQMTAVCA